MKKTIVRTLTLVAYSVCALMLYSCDPQDENVLEEQPVKFSFDLRDPSIDGGRGAETNVNAASVVVSIRDAVGTSVVTSKKLQLFEFNGKFISEPVALVPGNYYLYEFLVLDSDNKVLLAAPIDGSAKAYLVADPLDILFDVRKNKVIEIIPEVLNVHESSAQDFGYATFSFNEIETFDFLVSVFAFDKAKNRLVMTTADLVVKDLNQKFSYNKELPAVTNKITLPARYTKYTLKVTKPGYLPYIKTFNASSLASYNNENGPLTIVLEEGNLIFWNKLGSNDEVQNSEVGPDLDFYTFNDGLEVPANREYVPGVTGNAITIAPGDYFTMQRVHNVILNDLPSLLSSERGAIECYFLQNAMPVGFEHNPYRIFDGPFGFADMGIFSEDNQDGTNSLRFYLDLGGVEVSLEDEAFGSYTGQWVHVAAAWDRSGIGSSDETMQLFINGVKVASTTDNRWGNSFGQQADIAGGNDNDIARQFYVDEMKIYDYAKENF